jgi:hypothetical protein
MKTTSHTLSPSRASPNVGPGVTVDSLSVRLPGQSAAGGRRVAVRALELAASRLPPGLQGNFGRLSLRVRASSLTEQGLAQAIADALVETLTQHGEARNA